MTFGEKLKNIRIGCKKNQSEVCKAIGVSTRTLGFYENGEHLPKSAETYNKLSEYFNVPVEFWTTESEDDFTSVPNMPTVHRVRCRQKRWLTRSWGFLQADSYPRRTPTRLWR